MEAAVCIEVPPNSTLRKHLSAISDDELVDLLMTSSAEVSQLSPDDLSVTSKAVGEIDGSDGQQYKTVMEVGGEKCKLTLKRAGGEFLKCLRCWKWSNGCSNREHPLCPRCAKLLGTS